MDTQPSPVPHWFRSGDPWLSTRMRQVAEVAAAEREIGTAIERALALFLATAHARLLDRMPPGAVALRAAGTPDLAAWPEREQSWFALFERFVRTVLAAIFARRFRAEIHTITITVPVDQFSDAYLDHVWQRLKLVPELIFDEVREEIRASLADGDSDARTAARAAHLLRINAPSRRLARQLAQLQRTIDDPATKDAVRREARSRLAALRRRDEGDASRWFPLVRELARTEAVAVLNAASGSAAQALTQATGERRWKQWWSVRDERVRRAHREAHGQTKPVGEDFEVGGYFMAFPGDPTAPADLTTNCRCLLLVLSAEEGRRARDEYERARASPDPFEPITDPVTDPGRNLTAASDPRGGVSMTTALANPSTVQPGTAGPPVLAAGKASQARWRGVLAPLNALSGDNRMIAAPDGPPQHRTLPLPLLYQVATAEDHNNAVVVANIDRVWVQDGLLMGEGSFDLGDEQARDVVRKISDGYHRWVSVRLDNEMCEYRYYRDGQQLTLADLVAAEDDSDIQAVRVSTGWRLMSATLVAEPAFEQAAIYLLDDSADDSADAAAVTADATPEHSPAQPDPGNKPDADKPAAQPGQDPNPDPNPEPVTEPVTEPNGQPGAEPTGEPSGGESTTFADSGPSADKRKRAERSGAAMPGGRYPIENVEDLRKAIKAVGRAGGKEGTEADRKEVRRHIVKRAKAIGKQFLIPKNWASDGSLKNGSSAAQLLADADRRAWYDAVAAAVPMEPPASWFSDPKLTGPTKIRVTDEGRVFGHIAPWDVRHAALPGDVTPPRNRDTSYQKFHRHPVRTAEGTRVKTGPLAGHGHADRDERALWAVQRHYDDPNFVLADVVVGEDEWGIWASGALRPGVGAREVMFVDRYSFSGDWRGGELLAACLASVPGFHLDADDTVQSLAASAGLPEALTVVEASPSMYIEDGEVVTLVAAGVIAPDRSEWTADHAEGMRVALTFSDDPEEYGRQIGRGMFVGMQQAQADDEANRKAQTEFVSRVAGFERRVAAGQADHVARLRQRVERAGV